MTAPDRTARRVTLASASPARAKMLRDAGLAFAVRPARVDEARIRESMQAEGASAADAAAALAGLKAARVSARDPEALVIGADQILVHGDRWFGKPSGPAEARGQLRALRGSAHELATAACVALGGAEIWRHAARPRLVMRPFTDRFLESWIAASGAAVTESVGGYRLEARGAQLFSVIDGDFFTILGLPLLPLLAFLREHGVLER